MICTGAPPEKAFSPNSTLHWYNKSVRPGRKLGHVNFNVENHDELVRHMNQFQRSVTNNRPSP